MSGNKKSKYNAAEEKQQLIEPFSKKNPISEGMPSAKPQSLKEQQVEGVISALKHNVPLDYKDLRVLRDNLDKPVGINTTPEKRAARVKMLAQALVQLPDGILNNAVLSPLKGRKDPAYAALAMMLNEEIISQRANNKSDDEIVNGIVKKVSENKTFAKQDSDNVLEWVIAKLSSWLDKVLTKEEKGDWIRPNSQSTTNDLAPFDNSAIGISAQGPKEDAPPSYEERMGISAQGPKEDAPPSYEEITSQTRQNKTLDNQVSQNLNSSFTDKIGAEQKHDTFDRAQKPAQPRRSTEEEKKALFVRATEHRAKSSSNTGRGSGL